MRLTGLFAHAVPPGTTADAWMDEAEALARACDVDALDIFVESVAFGNEHLARWGAVARDLGLPLRAHVEQLATHRSVPVALEWGARSVDHLSCLHPDDVAPLAAAECAAVLLPGAEFLNREQARAGPRARRRGRDLRARHRLQPRHVPRDSMPLVIGLAVRLYGWSVREALLAATLNAAWVLGWSTSWARSSRASAPTCCCSTARRSTSPTASATTRWRR